MTDDYSHLQTTAYFHTYKQWRDVNAAPVACPDCGEDYQRSGPRQIRCTPCRKKHDKARWKADYKKKKKAP